MQSELFLKLQKLWQIQNDLEQIEKFLLEQWQQELQKVEQIKK